MPSFDAIAGSALTPGGVQSGLNDLVQSLMQAPIQRRQIEMQQAAQMAQQQMGQDELSLKQRQYESSDALDQTREKRLALEGAGDVAAKFQAAGNKGAGNGFTMEDAIGKTPAARNVPNPDATAVGPDGQPDYMKQLMAHPTIRQNLTPEERVAEAMRLQQAAQGAGGAGGSFIPINQTGHIPVDPQAMAIVNALRQMGGLSVGAGVPGAGPGQEPGGVAPSKDISPTGGVQPGSPAGAPGKPGQAAGGGKVASRQEIQQMAAQAGYTEQEAIEYYKSLGYTVQ